MSEIAFTYDETKNTDGAFFFGVPLRDLTVDEFNALRDGQKRAIIAAPYYVATGAVVEMPAESDAATATTKKKRG